MADKLKESVDDVTRFQPRAPRPRMHEIDRGKLYNQKKFDADVAAGAADLEDLKDTHRMNYAKGGQVGRVGQFGMHRSKPDFASGGAKTNFKMNTKKGTMPW